MTEETPPGPQESWKAAREGIVELLSALSSLASIRWSMARIEAARWSRAFLLRLALWTGAIALFLLSLALLIVAVVVAIAAWTGSLLSAIGISLAACVAIAFLLLWIASRSRATRPVLEATLKELARDIEAFKGEP